MLSETRNDVVILKETGKSYILTGIQLFHLTSLEVRAMIFFLFFFLNTLFLQGFHRFHLTISPRHVTRDDGPGSLYKYLHRRRSATKL